ncbi:hypothetical protein D3C78_929330 [compost metagenome]
MQARHTAGATIRWAGCSGRTSWPAPSRMIDCHRPNMSSGRRGYARRSAIMASRRKRIRTAACSACKRRTSFCVRTAAPRGCSSRRWRTGCCRRGFPSRGAGSSRRYAGMPGCWPGWRCWPTGWVPTSASSPTTRNPATCRIIGRARPCRRPVRRCRPPACRPSRCATGRSPCSCSTTCASPRRCNATPPRWSWRLGRNCSCWRM